MTLNYSTAPLCLRHSIVGDFNAVSLSEVEANGSLPLASSHAYWRRGGYRGEKMRLDNSRRGGSRDGEQIAHCAGGKR